VSSSGLWRKCVQQPALWLLCLPAGRLLRTTAVVTLLYVLSPWVPQSWMWWLECGVAVLLFAAFSDPSAAGTAALTLARRVQFGIRRSYLHRRAHPIMLNAGLKKPTTSNLALHGPSQHETPPVIKRLTRQTKYGMTLVFDGSKQGYDDWDFDKVAHTLKSKFSGTLLKGRIKLLGSCKDLFIEPDKRVEHFIRCELIYIDPFKQVITTGMLPPPSAPDRVVIGLDERGRPVEKNFKLPQLIAGEAGSGKSTEFRMQLLGLVRSGLPFITLVFDPKKQEYADIKDKAWYYQNDNNIDKFLTKCLEVLAVRQRQLAELGLANCPDNDPRFPYIIIPIDELITALAGMDKKVRNIEFGGAKYHAEGAFMVLLSTGRAAKVIPIAGTQLLQKAILEVLRDLFPYKSFLRQPSIESTRIAFPGENQARMYPAHELPREGSEGIAWMEIEGKITKYRGALPSPAEREEVAEGIWYWTQVYRDADPPRASQLKQKG
jgi:hypothetical protein